MDARAVEQAWERLRKAEKALLQLEHAQDFPAAEEAWIDFLTAANTIYVKLAAGARNYGKSNGWYGRKKNERKDDPLLRYLHYARNSDEHGIDRVVRREAGVSFEGPLGFGELRSTTVNFVHGTKKNQTVEKREFIQTGPRLMLIRAHDRRFNDYCDPPTHHRGKVIGDVRLFPDHVAALATFYLTEMVLEAEDLVLPSKAIAR